MGKKMTRRQKLKLKKIIRISVCSVIAVIVIAAIIINILQQRNARIFTDGTQSITLRENGTFTAELYHGVMRNGLYKEDGVDDITIISFDENGIVAVGFLMNDVLTYPEEWDDMHGHNRDLTLKQ